MNHEHEYSTPHRSDVHSWSWRPRFPTFTALTSFLGKKPSATRTEIKIQSTWEEITCRTRKSRNNLHQISPRSVGIEISPIFHTDINIWLAKFNRPGDNTDTTAMITVERDLRRHRNKPIKRKRTKNMEGEPNWDPPLKIHWDDGVIQVHITELSKYEITHKNDGEPGRRCGN